MLGESVKYRKDDGQYYLSPITLVLEMRQKAIGDTIIMQFPHQPTVPLINKDGQEAERYGLKELSIFYRKSPLDLFSLRSRILGHLLLILISLHLFMPLSYLRSSWFSASFSGSTISSKAVREEKVVLPIETLHLDSPVFWPGYPCISFHHPSFLSLEQLGLWSTSVPPAAAETIEFCRKAMTPNASNFLVSLPLSIWSVNCAAQVSCCLFINSCENYLLSKQKAATIFRAISRVFLKNIMR